MVLNNKEIDNVLYKKVNNELSDRNKNIFQEAKNLFNLRVEIYKKLVLEEENLQFEKSIGETIKLKNQKDNLSKTPEQKKFLEYIEGESKDVNYDFLNNILILKYLVLWQKNYLRQKIKKKTMSW